MNSNSARSHPDFSLQREIELPDVRAYAREFLHEPSGAKVLHLETDDTENYFALVFATPPDGDHGVAHILEHAVLAGSEKFPLREPFFEMLKSSPAGFINAMTSDLWTVYPICTTLEADFFNLAEVYADAVFHPFLTRETFEREGHHLQLEKPGDLDSRLERSGIVYNEMKSAFSDPEAAVWRSQCKLFPGGALGWEAGGDPSVIPQLTHEHLREFHRRFYNPANCTLILYGDIALEKQLVFWGEKLSGFDHESSLAARPAFEPWSTPRRMEEGYNVEPNSDLKERTFLSLRWHVGDALGQIERTAWHVLTRLLAGHDSAPLKKALIDSRLGADVFVARAHAVESEMVFHVALKGSERERADAFQELVLDTLRSIAETGFEREAIETALRQTAYIMQEVHTLYPLHLSMVMASYAACGDDAFQAACGRTYLEQLRQIESQDADYFPRMIREKLLTNPHRLLGIFYPDPEHATRENEREAGELAALKASFSREALLEIDERAQSLEKSNGVPNSPAAIATLPRLSKTDLPDAPREVPSTLIASSGFPVLKNDVFSNGICYALASVDVSDLPLSMWKFLPRFADAFSKMGAGTDSWEKIAARRAACTGWMNARPQALLDATTGARRIALGVGFNALESDLGDALDLLMDLVFGLEPRDRARLHDMQIQGTARLRSTLLGYPSGAATNAAARAHSPAGPLQYLWESPLAFAWMKELTENFETHADELIGGIEALRGFLCDPQRWTWSFTGSDAAFQVLESKLNAWRSRAASAVRTVSFVEMSTSRWDGECELPTLLGLAAPLDVKHCVQAFPLPACEKLPLMDLGIGILRHDYFLPEIRFKGNAYGAGFRLSEEHGVATFFSYADPRLNETLEVFERAPAWIAAQQWTDADLERALLGDARSAIPAIRPLDATMKVLQQHIRGESAAMRLARYREKLSATPQQVHDALGEYFDWAMPRATIAVAASRAALESANEERRTTEQDVFEIEEILPE